MKHLNLTRLFKLAADDPGLTDEQVRDIVRFVSDEPITDRDVSRTYQLAIIHGWLRAHEAVRIAECPSDAHGWFDCANCGVSKILEDDAVVCETCWRAYRTPDMRRNNELHQK